MIIDSSSRRNLELVQSFHSARKHGTLLGILDQTRTPMGGRMLVQWIIKPLMDLAGIEQRHDAVEEWAGRAADRAAVIDTLKQCGDLERLLARFATGRANARDAIAVLSSLRVVESLIGQLGECKAGLMIKAREGLQPLPELRDEIERALVSDPPLSITDGGFIRRGYNKDLDDLRDIAFSGKDWIARLQLQERERTGIPSLKVNFNKVFGYYIEVTNPNLSRVPAYYIRKQTMVNAERYITPELKEYEEKVLGAEEKIVDLEYELFDQLRRRILTDTVALQENARILAQLDCLSCLAQVAIDYQLCAPPDARERKSGDNRWTPSGHRTAAAARRNLYCQRLASGHQKRAAPDHNRSQYGGQIDLFASGRADCHHGPAREFCASGRSGDWSG